MSKASPNFQHQLAAHALILSDSDQILLKNMSQVLAEGINRVHFYVRNAGGVLLVYPSSQVLSHYDPPELHPYDFRSL